MGRSKTIITDVTITGFSFPNNGIAEIEKGKVKIKNSLPGQKLTVQIKKSRKGMKGRILEKLQPAPNEITPACQDFGVCGGCTFQNITYQDELKLKESMILDLFATNNINYTNYNGINPSPNTTAYRNKMEYSFGDESKGGALALGMRKRDSHYEVVTSHNCNIVDTDFHTIVNTTLNFFQDSNDTFYHKATHVGTLRHLLVRKGEFTGDIIVGLVTTSNFQSDINEFSRILLDNAYLGNIVGIYHIINDSVADVVKADELRVVFGQDYFFDELLGLQFKISVFSFFQTNSQGAEKLYSIVQNMLGDCTDKIVYDLYCGTGTIAQIVSNKCKKVIGVEIVEEAIVSAKLNAELNNITNCEFIAGDVLKVLDNIIDKPDFIILDPPREGINPKALEKIINYGIPQIIYVSCKPTSLVRDLKVFEQSGYTVTTLEIQDMFPRTYHVETVVLLTKTF